MLNYKAKGAVKNIKVLVISVFALLIISLMLPLNTVSSVTPPPMAQLFYGTVTLDGSPAPDGTSVTAVMNNETYSTTVSGGEYNLTVGGKSGDSTGDTIYFYVDGLDAGSTTYSEGGETQFHLSATSPLPQRTLTMSVDGQGSTSPSVGSHNYNEGQTVSIFASPATGWAFSNWVGDVASPNSQSTTVTMDEDKTVTAVFFELPTYTLTMAVSGEGTVTPSPGNYTHEEGAVVNISASPAEGWRFVNWTGGVADPNSPDTTVNMDTDRTVTANFAPRDSFALTINIEGEGSTSPVAGTHNYARDEVVEVTATPAAGYKFDSWIGDVSDPAAATTTVTIDADKVITARFVPLTYYELTIEVDGNGTTEPAPGTHSYPEGQTVSISAEPDEGYEFTGWIGDVADTEKETTTILMDDHKTIIATFDEIPLPPVFTKIEVLLTTRTEAVITWETDKPATGQLEYGAENTEGKLTEFYSDFSTRHVALIDGLEPGKTYYFTIIAIDEYGNETISPENSFSTAFDDAKFIITGWEATIDYGNGSKEVVIDITIKNTGDLPGGHELTLKVNGVIEDSASLTLEPLSSGNISFNATLDQIGFYTIEVNGFKLGLEVPQPVEEPVTPDPDPVSIAEWLKNNWLIVLGVLLGIILLITIGIIIIRRYYYIVTFIRR